MSTTPGQTLTLGLSPCPNDTFIFHALLHGLVPQPAPIAPHLADVEELNTLARQGKLAVTKMSLGVAAEIMHDYALLSSGAALGFGCGPLVVAREPLDAAACRTARVAVPGLHTTANLLLSLNGGFEGPREAMLFSDVMDAVIEGRADAGVIIHEGRFTFAERGLVKLLDLGEWWEGAFHLPLPLGAIVVRRDVPRDLALGVQAAIAQSLRHARSNPQASAAFIREHAQELDESVIRAHIETFVTDFSLDLGDAGRAAITELVGKAAALAGKALPKSGLFLS